MLSATDLGCSRGPRTLFEHLDLSVDAGQWLYVSGANGAGKTTLLRTLVGLSPPDHGDIRWRGRPVREQQDEFRRATLYLGHPAAVKDELTPIENLQWGCGIDAHRLAREVAEAALQRIGLLGRATLPTRFLSAGQKRRVLLARLLVRPAVLWVLDEPFAALDGAAVNLVTDLLREHLATGGMAVLTSHQPVPLGHGRSVAL